MFSKLALLALVAPLVSALTLHVPQEIHTQGQVTITWDTAPGDPEVFTLQLLNEEFHDSFAIANNIDPNQGSITLTIPVVPVRGGYTLAAINVGNVGEVYSQTGVFSVLPLQSSSNSSPTPSQTGTGTQTTSTTRTVTPTSTGTGTTPTNTSTNLSTPTPSPSNVTPTNTNTQNTPNPNATNLSGASSIKFNAGAVVAGLAGVAGAVALAL